MMNFGQRIAHARKLAGQKIGRDISQSELARAVGVKPQSIQAIESGKVESSRITVKAHRVLGVPLDWLDAGLGDAPTEAFPSTDVFKNISSEANSAPEEDERILLVIGRIDAEKKRAVADMLERMFPLEE